jgi:hypothetical protein
MTNLKLLPLAAGAAATALMVLSTPALADTPLAFDSYSSCYQTTGGYDTASFECDISWSGGTGAVTATFTPANSYTGGLIVFDSGPDYADLTGGCSTSGRSAAVTATLTDSTNASVSQRFWTSCSQIVP